MDKEIVSALRHIWWMLLLLNINALVLISIAYRIMKQN